MRHIAFSHNVMFLWVMKKAGCILFLSPYETIIVLTTQRKKNLESIMGKRENAGKQLFLLLPQCFQKKEELRKHHGKAAFSPFSTMFYNNNKSQHLSDIELVFCNCFQFESV